MTEAAAIYQVKPLTEPKIEPHGAANDVLADTADLIDGHAVVRLSRTEQALRQLRADLTGKAYDLTTTAGDKAARSDRLLCVTLRGDLERRRKALKAPALEFGKIIDAEAKRITEAILVLEAPIDAAIKADEKRRADEKAEAERIAEAARAAVAAAEAQRLADLRALVERYLRGWVRRCDADGMTSTRIAEGVVALTAMDAPADFADVADHWARAKDSTLLVMQARRVQLLEAELQAQRQATQSALEAQAAAQPAPPDPVLAADQDQPPPPDAPVDPDTGEVLSGNVSTQAEEAPPAAVVIAEPAAPQARSEPAGRMVKLGAIREALGFAVTEDFLTGLGFPPDGQEKAAKLYRASRWPVMREALVQHVRGVEV